LTPIVGFIPSALFLGEPITLTLVASGALIAAGVSLTMRSRANGKLRNPPTVL
jgi:drug/metabolite transporter (DMT)-like permease